ncbi:unnamed protein product [Angiostrongylus costaricensis]|uniref:Ovule protein n=1 Tax=Angiostrongylus costaricensis TaxID=334426 RepID=A0A0R3PUX4_ANGCS|nr:unnamed protein product [Angiostrongylus costaricensis]
MFTNDVSSFVVAAAKFIDMCCDKYDMMRRNGNLRTRPIDNLNTSTIMLSFFSAEELFYSSQTGMFFFLICFDRES